MDATKHTMRGPYYIGHAELDSLTLSQTKRYSGEVGNEHPKDTTGTVWMSRENHKMW